MASSDCNKENRGSHPTGLVRVVARIRGFTNRERELAKSSLTPWISIQKPKGEASDAVTLSFEDQSASQKESCQVHYCYDQDENTDMMYSREIKPLVSGIFDGRDATVVAYGAIGSGKTYTIQGSEEKPGLAILAMDEMISTAERLGISVTISLYEIYQEHAYDLLNPERPTVMVLKDVQGRIKLKGLSQAPVKSVSEFCKTYLSASSPRKAIQKHATQLSRRSHKCLIVKFVTPTNSEVSHVGKMNFVDLAGYEDPRRKRSDCTKIAENNALSKSLYALQKVVLALNANESHIPFRESKLTHMLQDSLGGVNGLIFIACLNPSFCQDSIYMASLASRTYQGIRQSIMDSTKKTKSLNRLAALSSGKPRIPQSSSASMKKQTGSRMHFLQKKVSGATVIKGKKLFDEANNSKKYMKATSTSTSCVASTMKTETPDKATSTVTVPFFETTVNTETGDEATSTVTVPSVETTVYTETGDEATSTVTVPSIEITPPLEEESSVDAAKAAAPLKEVSEHASQKSLENQVDLSSEASCTTEALSLDKEGDIMDKENTVQYIDVGGSPPLCARLREISSNLKLVDSTPTCIDLPKQGNLPCDGQISAEPKDFEPRTPPFESGKGNERPYLNTPREVSKTCYCGTKNSLVQEYLRFVNSASKEDLKGLKGIGEKRATRILEIREESPEPFKSLEDLKDIGLSAKQIKGMFAMK
ncbi:kinesin-like protein KIN-10C [Punica granatum]|uniref:Kinesin-like protein KIF22 n=2 Tax=Punica granatum TaxID=22663 RepID=A0A218WT03_PUNGR|nr:kinesin-like protein KIN-10C [Punica granatum]OWM75608.1 hypothetical protein CDL15_Pgr021773 [Punica granatum]PKI52070.1 hypothetical protein CRG98_027486 [Punica granatum]